MNNLARLRSFAFLFFFCAIALTSCGANGQRIGSALTPTLPNSPSSTTTIQPRIITTIPPSLSETPTLQLTKSPTQKPAGAENLPKNVMLVPNEDGSWEIKIGNEAKTIPGAVFDATGLHMTLDSGRIVDIAASELGKGIVYDQEINLLKIYDAEGIISAEYDLGFGQPNTPDYIPGQGWVDMQNLADVACGNGSACFVENARGLPNGTVSVKLISAGILRKITALDAQTNEPMGGEFLLLQFVTQNTTGKPAIGWMIVQGSILSKPGHNISPVSEIIQLMHGTPLGSTDDKLQSIEQWQNWMPKGSKWSFGFLSDGSFSGSYWSTSQLGSVASQEKRAQFLISHGDTPSNNICPFTIISG